MKSTSPKKVDPLATDVTTNPSSGFVDAVTEPLRILLWSNPTIASAGILNNFSPEPLNAEPDSTLTSPKKVEPLSSAVTMNPSIWSTDAVTEPEVICVKLRSTNDSAGILNNPPPSPTNRVPLICVFATNPLFGDITA